MIVKNDRIKLASDLAELPKLEGFIELICDQYNVYSSYFGNILMSVTEAFENAVSHGNKNMSNKEVIVEFENTPKGLLFSVSDEGEGFDLDKIENPLDAETEEKSQKGRGIFLINALSDKVDFEQNGTTVKMLFTISNINKELSDKRVKALKSYLNSSVSIKN